MGRKKARICGHWWIGAGSGHERELARGEVAAQLIHVTRFAVGQIGPLRDVCRFPAYFRVLAQEHAASAVSDSRRGLGFKLERARVKRNIVTLAAIVG